MNHSPLKEMRSVIKGMRSGLGMPEFSKNHPTLASAFYFAASVGAVMGSVASAITYEPTQAIGAVILGDVAALTLMQKAVSLWFTDCEGRCEEKSMTGGGVRDVSPWDGFGQIHANPAVISVAKPGDRMSDGTIFAGLSPDTEEPMYTTPRDAPLTYRFNRARKYAAKLEAHGHHDWRVPTKRELAVLFNNRVAVGGFNQMDSGPSCWYRSSSQVDVIYVWWAQRLTTWAQRFSDGARYDFPKGAALSLRCVR